MSVIRGVKDRRFNFVQLLNSMFEDPHLSLKAKGFIGYCLTKIPEWKFHMSHLTEALKEGETAIYSVINECIKQGYAIRFQPRDATGDFLPWETIVSDSKHEIDEIAKELKIPRQIQNNFTDRGFPDAQLAVPQNLSPNNMNINNKKEQQQQAATPPAPAKPADAAVSSEKKKEQQSYQVKPKPMQVEVKPKIYQCLQDQPILEACKVEITSRYDEDTVKNAIAWAVHPETRLNKGLAPAIKWACQNKPEAPKKRTDQVEENKAYAKRYDGMKNGYYTVNVLNAVVEIDFGTAFKEPFALEYTAKNFKDQLENALRKANFTIKDRQ